MAQKVYLGLLMKTTHAANPSPVANFNLHETGPVPPSEARQRLGADFKLARKPRDPRATHDPENCPHCGAAVEWAQTSAVQGSKIMPYVYARCTGPVRHSWGFKGHSDYRRRLTEVQATPPGKELLDLLDANITEMKTKLMAFEELRKQLGKN